MSNKANIEAAEVKTLYGFVQEKKIKVSRGENKVITGIYISEASNIETYLTKLGMKPTYFSFSNHGIAIDVEGFNNFVGPVSKKILKDAAPVSEKAKLMADAKPKKLIDKSQRFIEKKNSDDSLGASDWIGGYSDSMRSNLSRG